MYALLLIILLPILWGIHQFKDFSNVMDLSVLTICIFTFTSLGSYIVLSRLKSSPRQQMFISFTMANTLVKMILSVLILIFYRNANVEIKNGKFIIPFLIIYFVFIIFETKVFLSVADQKSLSR
jgi:uncharacterized membrane protein YkvI